MNEQIGAPVLRAYRRGHPAPKLYQAALIGAWGFVAYSSVASGGVWNDLFAILAAVFVGGHAYVLATWKLRCRMYHAAEIVVITAMKAYPVTDEQEKEILEARRG
jgi:hypothetical protein